MAGFWAQQHRHKETASKMHIKGISFLMRIFVLLKSVLNENVLFVYDKLSALLTAVNCNASALTNGCELNEVVFIH